MDIGRGDAPIPAVALEIRRADSPEDRRAVFRLRHHVFVNEMGYRIPGVDPDTGLREPEDEAERAIAATNKA